MLSAPNPSLVKTGLKRLKEHAPELVIAAEDSAGWIIMIGDTEYVLSSDWTIADEWIIVGACRHYLSEMGYDLNLAASGSINVVSRSHDCTPVHANPRNEAYAVIELTISAIRQEKDREVET